MAITTNDNIQIPKKGMSTKFFALSTEDRMMTEELIDLIINTEHQEIGSGAGRMLRAWSPLEKQLASELATLRERVATLENALVDTLLENKPTDATCACYGEENNCAWHRAFHLVGEKYLKAWEAGSDLDRTAGGEQ